MRVACVMWPEPAEAERRPRAWAACLDALEGLAPVVEPARPGVAYADVTTLERHYPDALAVARVLGFAARHAVVFLPTVAIAGSPFAAHVAARHAVPGAVVAWPDGGDSVALAPLALETLALDADLLDALRDAGLTTFGDLAALPPSSVLAEFGLPARRAQRLARGEVERPLRPRHLVQREMSRQSFEAPIHDPMRLRALVSIQARDLAERFQAQGLRYARLRLTGELLTDDVWQSSRLVSMADDRAPAPRRTTGSPGVAPSLVRGRASLVRLLDDALADWPVADGVRAVMMALETSPTPAAPGRVLRLAARRGS